MESEQSARTTHQLFRYSILLKGAFSLFEVLGGILIFFVSPELVLRLAALLTHDELSEDPADLISNYLLHAAGQYSPHTEIFIGIYLLSRGLIKLGLITALLKEKFWAYPASIVVLGIFVLYQFYQIWHTHSLVIVAVTLFDLLVIYFIYREWKRLKGAA
jgi:uncharacterized membrane protein